MNTIGIDNENNNVNCDIHTPVTDSRTVASEYETENGIIRSPGKFEGEPVYAPHFYDALLNGFADTDEGDVATFEVNDDDRKLFPELADVQNVYLWESDQGFVYTRTSPFNF